MQVKNRQFDSHAVHNSYKNLFIVFVSFVGFVGRAFSTTSDIRDRMTGPTKPAECRQQGESQVREFLR